MNDRKNYLKTLKAHKQKELEGVGKQIGQTLSKRDQIKLERQAEELIEEIEKIDKEIKQIEEIASQTLYNRSSTDKIIEDISSHELYKLLERIIDENKIAYTIEDDKHNLVNNVKRNLLCKIKNMGHFDIFILCLVEKETVIQEIKIDISGEYPQVLIAFLKSEKYKGYLIHSKIIFETSEVLKEVISKFYTGYKVKNVIIKTLSEITLEKIKTAIRSLNIEQDNPDVIATKVKHLLEKYQVTSQTEVSIDQAFKDEIWKIITESGLLALLSLTLPKIIAPLAIHLLSYVGINITINTVLWFTIPLSMFVIIQQAVSFKDNVAKKVSKNVADQVNNTFTNLNFSLVKKLKELTIEKIINFYNKTKDEL